MMFFIFELLILSGTRLKSKNVLKIMCFLHIAPKVSLDLKRYFFIQRALLNSVCKIIFNFLYYMTI